MTKFSSPKNILITGASGGIGSALASIYAAPGIKLALTGRDSERLQHTVSSCKKLGADVFYQCFDITNKNFLNEWIKSITQMMPIDLVIANAGISSSVGPNGEEESLDMTEQIFNVNLHAAINTISPIISVMRQRREGQVAIISSLAAFRGLPQSPAYCASKSAIKTYGESLRAWLAGEGIGVSVICPGFIKSGMTDKLKGPKPFMISSDQAATIIKKRLQQNDGLITFPLPLALSLKILNIMPIRWSDKLLARFKAYVQHNDS